jgi:hypothetical protein
MPHSNKPIASAWSWTLFLSALVFLTIPRLAADDLKILQQSTVDTKALTFADGNKTRFGNFPNGVTHQQFPLRTFRGYQYAIYYDHERQVCVGRRKLPAGPWEIIRFTDYKITNNDTHNVAILGICENDGTIHLTWDHHVSDLHYRKSEVGAANDPDNTPWTTDLFGPVTNELDRIGPITEVTYPRFVSMPNGNLMLYYRFVTSGNGDSIIRVDDGNKNKWSKSHGKFIDRQIGKFKFNGKTSQYRYAYINGIGYGGNRLHVSWVWRDRFEKTSASNQHDLCYAYSDDDGLTWNNSAGERIAVTGKSFINLDSPGLIVHPIDPGRGASNQNTQYAYPDGSFHVILPRYQEGSSGSKRYHHHWRDAIGTWHVAELAFSGSRPELVGDDQHNLFVIYTAGHNLRILKGTPNADISAWTWSLIYNNDEPGSAGDGQIDLSRWQSEQVLSVYHQEAPPSILDYGTGPPIDGIPSPLHVTDFWVSSGSKRPHTACKANRVTRTLTSREGISAEAELLDVKSGKLICIVDGERLEIPISELVSEDVKFLREWFHQNEQKH